MITTARKLVKTNIEGFQKDLGTNAVLSSKESYEKYKEELRKSELNNEINMLKQNVSQMKNNIEQIKEILLRVVNGKPNC